MPSIQETAYPRLKSNLTIKELRAIYTPTAEELALARRVTKGRVPRLGFLTLLKTFQRLGYAVPTASLPAGIIRQVAATAQRSVSSQELAGYDASGTRKRHLAIIRDYLSLRSYSQAAHQVMAQAMATAALTKHDIVDLINIAIEELVRQRYELPAFSTLERAARQVRTAVTEDLYHQVTRALSPAEQLNINALLRVEDETVYSCWNALKQEPGKPTRSHLQALVERLQWLSPLQVSPAALANVPEVKVKALAAEAQTLDAARMKELAPKKRYTLAAALLAVQYTRTLDDLAEMFIKQMQQIHHKAEEALAQYRLETQKRTDELVATLRDVVIAYQGDGDPAQRFTAIETLLDGRAEAVLEQCDAHLAYAGHNYFPFLQQFYKSQRSVLFRFLEQVSLRSSTQDTSLLEAIQFIQTHRHSRRTWLPIPGIENSGSPEDDALHLRDWSWIPPKWWFLVTGQRQRQPEPEQIHRRHFEMCVFSHIWLELKSGDLYIEGSWEYGDYYRQLISWEEYQAGVAEYGRQVDLPVDAGEFIAQLKQWLASTAQATDQSFPANTEVNFIKDRLVIRRPKRRTPKGLAQLETWISERIRPIHLLDVLTDTELWLNWTRFFKPISGYEAKLENSVARYLATTFCYGCHIGPSQTARSLTEFDRRQLAWVHQRHVSEANLQEAITSIINAYNCFQLPKYWGSSKQVSVDGTKWDIYEQNLLAEFHIRYGGYGGIGYYHVSDTYIALFSHFIPCGVYEAIYILDGLLNNSSEIQPDTVYGDTHSQSATVFGLAYLLGITLMPRIRNWQDLKFYRPDCSSRYKHIDPLFSESIDWNLIEMHLPDMLRVALSIKAGKINASTILRKLGTNSRKNKLYQAFHALGCVLRTGFLLCYLNDADLRATIQAATNKSEAFNGFIKWLAFGVSSVKDGP